MPTLITPRRVPAPLAGQVAIITGASSGIGEAAAREFARAGAAVVLAARRAERLRALALAIEAEGGAALPVSTDLTDFAQVEHLVQATLTAFGRIDILANIAGWGRYDWYEELTADDLRQYYAVNVLGLAELTRQVVPAMQAQRSGLILNMSSYASKIAAPPMTVYASTKYAVEGLTDALRRELAPWGITVIRVHPSAVTGTEFNQKAARQGGLRYTSLPLGRISREQLARALVRVVARPRRALLISRLYDPGVVANKLAPAVVDQLAWLWVRWKRRRELGRLGPTAPVRYRGLPSPLPLAALLLAAGLLRRMWKKPSQIAHRR